MQLVHDYCASRLFPAVYIGLSISVSFYTFTGSLHSCNVPCCKDKNTKRSYINACFEMLNYINAVLTLALQLLL